MILQDEALREMAEDREAGVDKVRGTDRNADDLKDGGNSSGRALTVLDLLLEVSEEFEFVLNWFAALQGSQGLRSQSLHGFARSSDHEEGAMESVETRVEIFFEAEIAVGDLAAGVMDRKDEG